MNNTIQRLLLFFIAVPIIVLVILFLPGFHHAAVALSLVLFTAGASWELASLLRAKGFPVRRLTSAGVGAIIPLLFWISTWLHHPIVPGRVALMGTAIILILLLTPFAFVKTDAINRLVPEVLGLVFTLLYPGILAGYLINIVSALPHSIEATLTFAALSLGNDSLAWLFGMTLGRRRNLIAVSPNKSEAGFVGGILGSVVLAFAAALIFPTMLPMKPLLIAAFGLATGAATIVGDLFESALKRSAGVKDSGHIIPGRGGFLDTLDSLLFAAPVFFGFCMVFGFFS
ncbi:MAG: phosphatidate cytidylyltransferase [Treponema sp.]|nr:phosphatidate cytidylyltransferase [Treponema sp.]